MQSKAFLLTNRRLKRGVFRTVAELQAAGIAVMGIVA